MANLLAEADWSGESAALSAVARRRLGAAGLLMAAFARGPADRLYLPAPLVPPPPSFDGPLADDAGGARGGWPGNPCQLSTQAPDARPSQLLAWASTAETWRLRQGGRPPVLAPLPPEGSVKGRPEAHGHGPDTREANGGATAPEARAAGQDWREPFWRTDLAEPDLARRLASRAWFHALATGLGLALPGSRLVGEPGDLPGAGGPREKPVAGADGWVLKRLWSAAGRNRAWLPGSAAPDAARTDWVRHALTRDGGLLLEPWMAREQDWGCIGWVESGACRIISCHRQWVDGRGRFQGILLWPGARLPSEAPDARFPAGAASQLEEATLAAGRALGAEGYQGPFGVDAWSYRLPNGPLNFQALGEVNVRCTMGLLAWAWSRALALPPDGRAWALRPQPPPASDARVAARALPPKGWVAGDGVGAWLSRAGLT